MDWKSLIPGLSTLRLVAMGGAALAALGGAAWVYHLYETNGRLQADLKAANQTINIATQAALDNAAAFDRMKRQSQIDLAAARDDQKAKDEIQNVNFGILYKIEAAPAADDGPIAPVMRLALKCLRWADTNKGSAKDSPCDAGAPALNSGLPAHSVGAGPK